MESKFQRSTIAGNCLYEIRKIIHQLFRSESSTYFTLDDFPQIDELF